MQPGMRLQQAAPGSSREDTAMRIARITRRVASVVGEMNYAQRRLVAVLMGCKDS